jgi:O-antigen ligase
LLGYGFNAFEPVVTKEWFGQEDASVGAHNTFLQALFTVGFVGTLPLVAAFGVLIYRWLTRPDALRDVVTAYLLVAGMTEVEISSIPVLLTLLAFLVIALDAARCRPGPPTARLRDKARPSPHTTSTIVSQRVMQERDDDCRVGPPASGRHG